MQLLATAGHVALYDFDVATRRWVRAVVVEERGERGTAQSGQREGACVVRYSRIRCQQQRRLCCRL